MKNYSTTARYFGPLEIEAISRLSYEKASIITEKQLARLLQKPSGSLTKLIFRLKQKGVFKPIKKSTYLFSPLEAGIQGKNINEYMIPVMYFPEKDYYLGFSTMYSYYGFTDQIFQVMTVLNTKFQKEKIIGSIRFKFIKISPKRLYGTKEIKINNIGVMVSDIERTLVDLIYANDALGGQRTAFEIFREQVKKPEINVNKLTEYTLKFPNLITRKRIGYLLEDADIVSKVLTKLQKSIAFSALVPLFSGKTRQGKINKRWRLIENA